VTARPRRHAGTSSSSHVPGQQHATRATSPRPHSMRVFGWPASPRAQGREIGLWTQNGSHACHRGRTTVGAARTASISGRTGAGSESIMFNRIPDGNPDPPKVYARTQADRTPCAATPTACAPEPNALTGQACARPGHLVRACRAARARQGRDPHRHIPHPGPDAGRQPRRTRAAARATASTGWRRSVRDDSDRRATE
jgi:hypothetical protein